MEKNLSFFDDRPISDRDRDWMWQSDFDMGANQQIKEIAQRIIRPLTNPNDPSESITFAIHGRWGAGKTSFVELVMADARAELGDIDASRLIFCKFNASSQQNTKQPARVSLAMQVLISLAESTMQDNTQLEDVKSRALQIYSSSAYKQDIDIDDIVDKNQPIFERITQINRNLEQVATELANSASFSETVQAELAGRGEVSPMSERVLVVFVDDLDRCRQDYITEILDVIQQWGTTKRLYFILAIDRYILDAVIRDYYGGIVGDRDNPNNQVAIEKYVQHSYEIPELNEAGVRNYLISLFAGYESTPLAQVLLQNVPLFASSLRARTPRSIKRCINTIRLPLENASSSTEGKDENVELTLEHRLKEELLRFTWRDFYNNVYVKARDNVSQFYNAFISLERASVLYLNDRQLHEFELNRIRQRLQVGMETIPNDDLLASFLGYQPWFFLTQQLLQKDSATLLEGIVAADTPENTSEAVDLLRPAPQRQFDDLYAAYDKIDHKRDPQAFLDIAVKVYELARENFEALSEETGPRIGNIALRIESLLQNYGNEQLQNLALSMFDISYRLAPRHANNNCNFASFIVDTKIPPLRNLYEAAYGQILGMDDTIYRNNNRLARYHHHKAELAFKMAEERPDMQGVWEQHIRVLSQLIDETPSQNGLLRALAFVSKYDVSDDEKIDLLVEPIMRVATGRMQNLCLKSLADAFDDPSRSCELYAWLLVDTRSNPLLDRELRADVQHNFAVNLRRDFNFYAKALDLWYEAYHTYINDLGKTDGNIERAFVAFIDEYCHEKEYMDLIKEGKPLPAKPTLTAPSAEPPVPFIPGGIQAILGDYIF